jgi:hypothetical protein
MTSLPRNRSILYVGIVETYGTSSYRFESLLALGQQVRAFNPAEYEPSSRAVRWMRLRYPYGPLIVRINGDLRRAVAEMKPDVVWFDKPMAFTEKTMNAIHRAGAKIVFYVQDAPFGPRNDGCWRQFRNVYRMADLHCLLRKADVARYKARGLPWIETMFSYDSRVHYPPPGDFTDAERDREVSYIGHPHEERPQFLLKLARDHKLPVFVNGNRWQRVLNAEELKFFRLGDFLAGGQYREAIWRSKINMSFVTEDNEDDIAHKAVETAACGGFLLALRTEGHQALFEEDREAVFFSSVEECADKARFYLGRPDLREAIAARGRERALRGGYDNDTQLARILNRLDGLQV